LLLDEPPEKLTYHHWPDESVLGEDVQNISEGVFGNAVGSMLGPAVFAA